jgi:HSP20 family protein
MARNPLSSYRGGLARRDIGGDPFLSLHRKMNRLFDDVFRGAIGSSAPGGAQQGGGMMAPHMDVSETDSEIRICAELPGVKEDDVEVTLDGDVLTIRGEKNFERKDEKENYHFVERTYGTFQRSIRIPDPVNPDEVKAAFHNGVLTVTLPKVPQEDRRRRIPVQRSRSAQATQPDTMQGAPSKAQQDISQS